MLSPIPTKALSQKGRVQFKDKSDEKRLSSFTMAFLQDLAKSSDVILIFVTSTSRSATEQANAMYDKVAKGQFDSYAKSGASVQDIAKTGISLKENRALTVEKMLTQIDKVGFSNVSQHAGIFGLDVIDIAISTMTDKEQASVLATLRRKFGYPVYKLGHPTGPKPGTKYEFRDHGCFHISIIQPQEAELLSRTA